jgi:hypothetical protein
MFGNLRRWYLKEMTDPTAYSRSLEYRGFTLVVTRLPKQWQVTLIPNSPEDLTPEPERLLGWQEDEVLSRARIRVNDLLELRQPR